jgi:hypothetical protein
VAPSVLFARPETQPVGPPWRYPQAMRTPFDGLAKDLWRDTLGDLGRVTSEAEVSPAPQRADTTFEPDPLVPSPPGLRGRIAADPCMLEAFHQAPDSEEVRECLRKFLNWRHALREPLRSRARLWLVVAGDPRTVRREFHLPPLSGVALGDLRSPTGDRPANALDPSAPSHT